MDDGSKVIFIICYLGFYEPGSAERTFAEVLLFSGQSYEGLFKPLGRNWEENG